MRDDGEVEDEPEPHRVEGEVATHLAQRLLVPPRVRLRELGQLLRARHVHVYRRHEEVVKPLRVAVHVAAVPLRLRQERLEEAEEDVQHRPLGVVGRERRLLRRPLEHLLLQLLVRQLLVALAWPVTTGAASGRAAPLHPLLCSVPLRRDRLQGRLFVAPVFLEDLLCGRAPEVERARRLQEGQLLRGRRRRRDHHPSHGARCAGERRSDPLSDTDRRPQRRGLVRARARFSTYVVHIRRKALVLVLEAHDNVPDLDSTAAMVAAEATGLGRPRRQPRPVFHRL